MNFLFGKKYPIFNSQGKIEHKTPKLFKNWVDFYRQDSEKNWRNHKGYGQFKDEKT